jgi:histidinol-phosphatase (PHP family)
LDAYCAFVREETDLRLGIEADFVSGREDRMATLLEARDWDYVVGSVHFLRDQAVDMRHSDWDVWRSSDPEEVWARYFETLGEAARTGMFDILAHPDLVKVWGSSAPVPEGDLRRFYELAMDGIAESDVAIEVSTAGLRKPVGEIYPAQPFLEMCLDAGRPVALSSDAHVPEELGYEYDMAVDWLAGLGVTELAVFERRSRRMEPLG